MDIIYFIFLGGVPYYLFLEKINLFNAKYIFILTSCLFMIGMSYFNYTSFITNQMFLFFSITTAIISLQRGLQTTNLYKLSYLLIFLNTPFILYFWETYGKFYSISLFSSLIGIFLIGFYYEKNYGSANYRSITGIIRKTPSAGSFLSVYLINLALYPPLSGAVFFFISILSKEINIIWFVLLIIIFFGNFLLTMRVMMKTIFENPNKNIHYIELHSKDKIIHLLIISIIFILSLYALKELFYEYS